MKTLKDRRVLITGAGHGLGQELAISFGRAGCEIIVTDKDSVRVKSTVDLLTKADIKAFGYSMDVTDSANVQSAVNRALFDRGPIDVLINNAGIVCGGSFENVTLDRHASTFMINTVGAIAVTHALLKQLIQQPDAHIVNIVSAAAFVPLPFASTYAASKAALHSFSDSLREELRLTHNRHVKVTTVCPGYIATGMFTGVKTPFLMPMLTPHILANKVVKAVRSNTEILRTPWPVKLLPIISSLFPRSVQRFLGDKLGILSGMRTWTGHEAPATSPNNNTANRHSA